MAAIALKLEAAGGWKLCRNGRDLDETLDSDTFTAVLHMEGCEAIDEDLAALEVFTPRACVRSDLSGAATISSLTAFRSPTR